MCVCCSFITLPCTHSIILTIPSPLITYFHASLFTNSFFLPSVISFSFSFFLFLPSFLPSSQFTSDPLHASSLSSPPSPSLSPVQATLEMLLFSQPSPTGDYHYSGKPLTFDLTLTIALHSQTHTWCFELLFEVNSKSNGDRNRDRKRERDWTEMCCSQQLWVSRGATLHAVGTIAAFVGAVTSWDFHHMPQSLTLCLCKSTRTMLIEDVFLRSVRWSRQSRQRQPRYVLSCRTVHISPQGSAYLTCRPVGICFPAHPPLCLCR